MDNRATSDIFFSHRILDTGKLPATGNNNEKREMSTRTLIFASILATFNLQQYAALEEVVAEKILALKKKEQKDQE